MGDAAGGNILCGHPQEEVDQFLLAFGLFPESLLHPFVNRFPQPRNAGHVLGFIFFEVVFDVANVGVDSRCPLGEEEVIGGTAETVPGGEDGENAIARLGLQDRADIGELVQEVAVGEADSFGFAGGAGGVEEGCQGLAGISGGFEGTIDPRSHQLRVVEDFQGVALGRGFIGE